MNFGTVSSPFTMLDLSSDSDMDYRQVRKQLRQYAGAMVSTSLGSVDSFRINSPKKTTSTKPTRYAKQQEEEPSPSTSELSLDGLIDEFRASASSISQRQQQHPPSPSPKRLTRRNLSSFKARVSSSESDNEDRGRYAVSPMPKLSQLPKPKPTLQIPATKKVAPTGAKPVYGLRAPKSPPRITPPQAKRSKLLSPKKVSRQPQLRAPPSPPSSPSLSNQSTASSVLDDIDAPDSDSTPEEPSLDDLIGHDLRKLRSLVSRSHDKFSPRNVDSQDSQPRATPAATPRRSSFRLHSPTTVQRPGSSFRLRPVDSILHRQESHSNPYPIAADVEDDLFAEELRLMKATMQREKQKKTEADVKLKAKDEAKKSESEELGANIGSMREAVDVIDKTLLLALRPFEQMRQAMDQEDAKAAAAEEKTMVALDLPMATQAIVEQLEQAFGGQTRQRQAELKAEEDAAAAATAVEEAKKKEDEDKKAAADLAHKAEEDKLLELIPLRGKLLTNDDDVHDTLLRLELAETLAREDVSRHHRSDTIEQLQALRAYAERRGHEIEREGPVNFTAPRAINWHRSTFHMDDDDIATASATKDQVSSQESTPFPEVVKKGVVEQLELTMLKLRHTLSIDEKENQEAELARKEAAERDQKQKRQEEEALRQRLQVEADAAAAQHRVMGLASLDELAWVSERDLQLRNSVRWDLATQRLENSFAEATPHSETATLPSFFDTSAGVASQRFDCIRTLMQAPYPPKQRTDEDHNRRRARDQHRSWSPSPQPSPRGRMPTRWSDNQSCDDDDNQRHNEVHLDQRRKRTNDRPRRRPVPQFGALSNNQRDADDGSFASIRTSRAVVSPSPPPHDSRRSHRFSSTSRDQLQQSMRLIQQLQADRREKTQWFQTARYR